jgi:hypothetical protein
MACCRGRDKRHQEVIRVSLVSVSESLGEESPQVNTPELPVNKPKFRLCRR